MISTLLKKGHYVYSVDLTDAPQNAGWYIWVAPVFFGIALKGAAMMIDQAFADQFTCEAYIQLHKNNIVRDFIKASRA